jgi:hypothetical protein
VIVVQQDHLCLGHHGTHEDYPSWISKITLNLMRERDDLQKKAAATKDSDDWKEFKKIQNKVNSRLKFKEKNWQKLKLEECSDNSGKVWKNVKGLLNWKSSGSPNQLFYNGSLI